MKKRERGVGKRRVLHPLSIDMSNSTGLFSRENLSIRLYTISGKLYNPSLCTNKKMMIAFVETQISNPRLYAKMKKDASSGHERTWFVGDHIDEINNAKKAIIELPQIQQKTDSEI